jgi:polyether ionophore transport system permease protein
VTAVAATRALAWREFVDARVRNIAFALLFGLFSFANAAEYTRTYPTLADRLQFAASFGDNKAVRLFYGTPFDLVTNGGYTEWHVGGLLVIFAAAWGLLAAVRAMRTEEDEGRWELVLSGAFGRRSAFGAAVLTIAGGIAVLWAAMFAGLVAGNLAAGGSALLALGTVSGAAVFVGVGAVASQLGSTRRVALELGGAALTVAFLLRVVADTSSSLSGLRWATPFGWAEELRPFSGARPAVLLLPAAVTVILLLAARWSWLRRDVGDGLLRTRETREPSLELLSSPTAHALRGERLSLAAWLLGTGAFALIIGILSASVSQVHISKSLEQQLQKLGNASITTASGYLSFTFLFFVLVVSLFACSQVAAARHEESDGRLETLFSLPAGRLRWFLGRLLLGVGGAAAIALAAGALAWVGAASQGADVSLVDMLEAGANCLPATVLFLSIGALAFALVPRATIGIAYGAVLLAFVWQLIGSILDVPAWTLELSPFHHIGLVPAQDFKTDAALVMLAIAAVTAIAALRIFKRRDLTGA